MTQSQNYREAMRLAEQAHHFTYGDGGDPVTGAALAAEAQVYATLELADAQRAAAVSSAPSGPLTLYRASHESIVMGRYTTAAEARKHCEADERRSWPTGTSLAFDWIEDEEDGVAELVVVAGQNEESTTGYTVTSLEIASEYDPEAEA